MNKKILSVLLFAVTFLSAQQKPIQIAFLSDVHFQDLYGSFSDNNFKGILNPKTGRETIMRTMDAQLHSTRIFNENYFAFLKALDDIAAKDIKIVAMPGDFSDDGQAYNLRGLRKILEYYHQKYGINFYLTTGNHDPVGPFRQDAGKDDFLGKDGLPLRIYSREVSGKTKGDQIITKDIATSGYLEILDELKDFGFYPAKDNLYWSTPFDRGAFNTYSYEKAIQCAGYTKRMYEVSKGFSIPDLSYVVEPVKGVWMMAIDGNTYIPKDVKAGPNDPANYHGASVGYNNVLTHKQHLIGWVKKVGVEAKKNNKTLIAFTHYPMIDFNDGASAEIEKLLGKNKWQLERVPEEDVADAFMKAGLQIHFAGHMHINDTGIRKKGNQMLVNVQVPSLAAYLPAYKVLTIRSPEKMEIHTEVLNNVPHFDDLFPLYKKEYEALSKKDDTIVWNKDILTAKSYHDFMLYHLKELVRLRMIPNEWPVDFIQKGKSLHGENLLIMSLFSSGDDLFKMMNDEKSKKQLEQKGIHTEAFKQWNFEDLLLDLYKFQSADELAKKDISKERLEQYGIIEKLYSVNTSQDPFILRLKSVFKILSMLSNGDPADYFEINLPNRSVKRL